MSHPVGAARAGREHPQRADVVPAERPEPARSWGTIAGRVLVGLPDRIVVWALCAMVATAIPVVLAVFHPWTVFPLFVVLIAVSWRMVPRLPAVTTTQIVCTVLVLLAAVVWLLVQRPYFGELLAVRRDPGIYTLRGVWLTQHASPDVQLTPQLLRITYAVPEAGLDFGSETYQLTRYFQSTTVVPGLIAVAGWISGDSLLLQANLAIGTGALIAAYAVGRRLAGPLFGLLPFVALALSMPMAAFSRVPYTEPLSMISALACLLGLWQAVREGRRAMWLLAGIGAGGVAIARIDGWLVVIGAFVGFGLWGGFAASTAVRRRAAAGLGWFALAALPTGAIGVADLLIHSPDYIRILGPSSKPLLLGVPASGLLALVVIFLPGLPRLGGWIRQHRRVLAAVSAAVIGLVTVLVLLRPLFWTAHFTSAAPNQVEIKLRQAREGLPIDPTRSYDERSLTWIAWYQGWPAVLLGCAVAAVAVWVGIRRRNAGIVLVTAVVAVNAALYLNDVSITPDQIWAMRRFLPVIIPGGLLLIGWALQRVVGHRERIAAVALGGLRGLTVLGRQRLVTIVVAVVALVVAVSPVSAWQQMFTVKEGAGQYDLVQKVCQQVKGEKVLLVGDIPQMGFFQPTFRNFCGSEVITLPKNEPPARIARVLSLWSPGTVHVVSFYSTGVPWSAPPPAQPLISDSYSMWESTLSRPPRTGNPESTTVWLGVARADGMVDPVQSL